MESQRLKILATKFWNGECTELEEQALKDAVLSGDMPRGFEDLEEYLLFIEEEKRTHVIADSFDQKMLQKIEGKRPKIVRLNILLRIAAMLVLVFGMTFIFNTYYNQEQSATTISSEFVDTYEDPEIAYQEVKKALMMLSDNMNNGLTHAEYLGEFHKATNKLKK